MFWKLISPAEPLHGKPAMLNPFSFRGEVGRLAYMVWAIPIFVSQYLFVWLIALVLGIPLKVNEKFYVYPLRSLVAHTSQTGDVPPPVHMTTPFLLLAFIYFMLMSWTLIALSYRRAVNAGSVGWMVAGILAPLIQLVSLAVFCFFPPRRETDRETPISANKRERRQSAWSGAAQGLLAGMALTLAAVFTSALIFGSYGYGVFLVSPLVIGAVTAFLANARSDVGIGETSEIVAGTSFLGGLALVATALEGVVCIIMASPLGIGAAILGGLVGRQLAISYKASGGQVASSVAILPLIFALEAAFPPSYKFNTEQVIRVNAPPEAVWKAIIHMDTISEPPSLVHRLGLSYPIRGRVLGSGVGALRHGEFSTGTAVERVTEWDNNRKLSFVVLQDVAALHELSPYQHVHAPHVHGYFRTHETSFELTQREPGVTEIVERTSHELRLNPALYWLSFARHMVNENNSRVLRHIRRQAEQNFVAGVEKLDYK
jgi:uncharacterized membrane protein YhaH (DUF805 family)